MATILEVYAKVCMHALIPVAREKDIKTALRYLAASYGTTTDTLALTETLEATYRERMRGYFAEHPKGQSTIRNTIQAVGQFLKAFHQLTDTSPVPLVPPPIPRPTHAKHEMITQSPYLMMRWLGQSSYYLPIDQWPGDIAQRWEAYRVARMHSIEPKSLLNQRQALKAYIGYHCLTPDERLEKLPDHACAKLRTRLFHDALTEIITPPVLTGWDDLFQPARLNSFITWHSWRVHTKADAEVPERHPSRPTRTGLMVALILGYLASYTDRPEAPKLFVLRQKLPAPKAIHDKKAPYHRFEFAELEQVAQAMMAEARRMTPSQSTKYPGAGVAIRFQTGLILAMAWRNPMRARNWCEALLGTNLVHVNGHWQWHFEGRELKIKVRRGEPNIFEPDVGPDIVPDLEEYLQRFRPYLPNSGHDRHVFLNRLGQTLRPPQLLERIKIHTYRYTGKRLFTHLLRSLFMTHHLTSGVDINSIAYAMNDTPLTVLDSYNELMADKHRPIIHEANQRALSNGHRYVLTSPVVPVTPKVPKPLKLDPHQMSLL